MHRSTLAGARELLVQGMTRFECRLKGRLINDALRRFSAFYAGQRRQGLSDTSYVTSLPGHVRSREGAVDRRRPENAVARCLLEYLRLEVHEQLESLTALTANHAEFRHSYARAVDSQEARQILLEYAVQLGASRWRSMGDRSAVNRWLSDDAMNDRYLRRRGEGELGLMFALDRLAMLVRHVASQMSQPNAAAELWERQRIESLVRDVLGYTGDRRVRVAAMQCLAMSLEPIAGNAARGLITDELMTTVQSFATDASADTWLQCAAIDALFNIDEELATRVIEKRLICPSAGDDLFVRRHCLRCVADRIDTFARRDVMWDHVVRDPNDSVRQQAAETLWRCPVDVAWPRLLQLIEQDKSRQVRAAALLGGLTAVERSELRSLYLQLLARRLESESDSFCQRVAIHVANRWLQLWQAESRSPQANAEVEQTFAGPIRSAICHVQQQCPSIPVRRWAAAAAEQLWVRLDPVARDAYLQLEPIVRKLRRGGRCRIPVRITRGINDDVLGRTLAVITQQDFGVDIIRGWRGYRLQRQPQFGFRCWRAWVEFWRPSTDKRQAYSHTVGRISSGAIRVPSRIMGELSQTKVPGEPLVISNDGTWRPFLPLVDDFVSSLHQNRMIPRPTRIYSSEGVTEIDVSRNPLRRAGAAVRLMVGFPALAELRNWDAASAQPANKYLQRMQREGFRVSFRPHPQQPADTSVTDFFPALLAIFHPSLWTLIQDLLTSYAYYFSSAFENTLPQLVFFTSMALLLFLGRHAWSNLRIWSARRSIPLSIGGWGTRGKSGTERLKAALLTGCGYGIVSKTTGCEAMFIQSPACGDPLEIPLYRPGDKATIWEQSHLLKMAAFMRPSVFLWECMALTPDYVDVLQQQWMHDDLATITNTYPDHEDLQGPSGLDVAKTITGFVPRGAHLLTTEQQMYPLVRDRCEQRHTSVTQVGWLESGLLTDDLLDRFPYREHPDNIALVAALAKEIGCDFDVAVKAMADHLIPDLGVLKTHPVAHVQDCEIEFTNGMSANERFGCLGNWQRLGFDRHDPSEDPGVFISTVVNNRADRVARSRVFASVLVNDLRADRHFLIGGNLKGLLGYIWETWGEFAETVSLRRDSGGWDADYASKMLEQLAKRFRVPATPSQVGCALEQMLSATVADLPADEAKQWAGNWQTSAMAMSDRLKTLGATDASLDRLTRHVQQIAQRHQQYCELRTSLAQVRNVEQAERLESQLRHVLKEWFAKKLVVIDNYDATGDEIIQHIVDETPPGYLNRVMGIQNIKGTGLDFVYRFHAWDTCEQACQLLSKPDQEGRAQALNMLESLPEYGLLCQHRLQQALEDVRHAHPPILPSLQLQLDSIQRRLDEGRRESEQRQRPNVDTSRSALRPWFDWTVSKLEQWMEVQDAVRRRKQADQIYRDLRDERIGRQRAVEELRLLNKRQKGGWLANRLLGHHD